MTDDERFDHVWDNPITVYAQLGTKDNSTYFEVFGDDPMAVATTAHIHSLSKNHVPGEKFLLGPLWVKRIRENARAIAQAVDALD